ncbi:hypothetical protein [uncultured Oceanisphaera sp.]|uniref:hypothetical protein n=1 Tax=unclassified Pseudoalteromonas TaxID=194690 RepID=UPI002634D1BF|nr:hypothetical protein [uncultured Oceanisphaera sp.]
MKIDTVTSHQYSSQRTGPKNSIESSNDSASFASILNTKVAQSASTDSSKSKDSNQADFTSMTRQEMFDWMNDQIQTGKMSLDESSPFLGMTMKISVATGQPVDMATDTTRANYVEKARSGIEWANNHDPDLAKRLQNAIDIMYRNQGREFGINARA